mmetsp:Transcript_4393/g.6426  ORF Transcript_4393/g.6426 Transcript_4393/m.6426 type:complete len:106 (-) Transcript_4393:554-871(-)|eukprot:CAMPEP_0194081592 /NCGR_PEP_ID=MMETSP0149-20130528/7328_1 /TAXON_ID=122233 /ORGANISM="Chaetoceros debilis, Strain MM31A-1" /LENGTH=105 /DNA_ID=CAMNT_0038763531 /DNA_START=104 /DNA_END=421 /DNA_ORIENTATION=+
MVKVWYEPPPYGPRTSLNRPAYGIGGDKGPKWVIRLSKQPPLKVITGFLAGFMCLAYLPMALNKQKLPYTLSPEYLAAQRAYMRYHNMNPIWGISSKQARAADDH